MREQKMGLNEVKKFKALETKELMKIEGGNAMKNPALVVASFFTKLFRI